MSSSNIENWLLSSQALSNVLSVWGSISDKSLSITNIIWPFSLLQTLFLVLVKEIDVAPACLKLGEDELTQEKWISKWAYTQCISQGAVFSFLLSRFYYFVVVLSLSPPLGKLFLTMKQDSTPRDECGLFLWRIKTPILMIVMCRQKKSFRMWGNGWVLTDLHSHFWREFPLTHSV